MHVHVLVDARQPINQPTNQPTNDNQVQKRARGVLARRRVEHLNFLRRSARTIQKFWVTHTAWVLAIRKLRQLAKERDGATRIQSLMRMKLGARRASRLRSFHLRMRDNKRLLDREFVVKNYFQEQGAAMTLQHWLKHRLHNRREWRFRGHDHAVLIQRNVRGFLVRSCHGDALRDAHAVGKLDRHLGASSNAALVRVSSVKLQCFIRQVSACWECARRRRWERRE